MEIIRVLRFPFLLILVFTRVAGAQSIDRFYPKDYEDARATFRTLTAGKAAGGAYAVPSATDSDLTVDWALFPATERKKTLLVLLSGIHGVEGYAGSALQRQFLEGAFPTLYRQELGVLLVHALNPFGFKHGHRTSESHVDLNRNCDIDPALFKTKNEGYDKIRSIIEREGPAGFMSWGLFKAILQVGKALYLDGFTRPQFSQAVSQGQYTSPKGFRFGGQAFEPQTVWLANLLKQEGAAYEEIVYLDIHTGLGKPAELHVITGERPGQNDPRLVQSLLKEHPYRESFELTTGDTPGFYRTTGGSDALPPVVLPGKRILGVTVEFGTVGDDTLRQIVQLNRMILENQGRHYGYRSAEDEREIKDEFFKLFYPREDAAWKAAVLKKGASFVEGALVKLGALKMFGAAPTDLEAEREENQR